MEKVNVLGGGRGGGGTVIRLPPGFRFHPTDEELVLQYLRRKVLSFPVPASIIPDIELSRFDPWDLPGGAAAASACGSEKERYFFNLKEAKYRSGSRANRAAGSGFWKATGRDRQIVSSRCNQVVGIKKSLVFYRGKPPHGSRTDWVMHEYSLSAAAAASATALNCVTPQKDSTTSMEDWVLCHVFQKKRAVKNEESEMVVDTEEGEARAGRIQFIDFMGRGNANPTSRHPASETSCITELSDESSSEEDSSCHS